MHGFIGKSLGNALYLLANYVKMKHWRLLLSIGGIVLIAILVSIYQESKVAMRKQAEYLLIQTVRIEIEKKYKELGWPHTSLQVATDTVPLTIVITTAKGRKKYKVDPLKSKKNISQIFSERNLSSIVCEVKPLSADTLQQLWVETLSDNTIQVAGATLSLTATKLNDEVIYSVSTTGKKSLFGRSDNFLFYVGSRCEMEFVASLDYFWWSVYAFSGFPLFPILIISLITFGLVGCLYFFRHRFFKKEVIEKTVVVVKEVSHNIYTPIKEVGDVEVKTYQLRPGLIFDSHKQILIVKGKKVKLRPQSCMILKLFLEAPNYTLEDEEILNHIWKKDSTATIKRFTVACSRIRNEFSEVGFTINFNRVGTDKYGMFLDDTDENPINDAEVVNGSS